MTPYGITRPQWVKKPKHITQQRGITVLASMKWTELYHGIIIFNRLKSEENLDATYDNNSETGKHKTIQ